MTKRPVLIGLLAAMAISVGVVTWHATAQAKTPTFHKKATSVADERNKWVVASLKEMTSIRVGMTKQDLMKVFTTEGGMTNATYVYRGCPNMKVDVEFKVAGMIGKPKWDKNGRLVSPGNPKSVITSISRPYLAWSVYD